MNKIDSLLSSTGEDKCTAVLACPSFCGRTLAQAVVFIGLPVLVGVGAVMAAYFSPVRSYRVALGITGSLAFVAPIFTVGGLKLLKRQQQKGDSVRQGNDETLVVGNKPSSGVRRYNNGVAAVYSIAALILFGTLLAGAFAWNSMAQASYRVRVLQKISTVASGVLFIGALAAGYRAKNRSEQQGIVPLSNVSFSRVLAHMICPAKK